MKKIFSVFILGFIFSFIFFTGTKQALGLSNSYDSTFPETNGVVVSVVMDEINNIVYLSGDFTTIGGKARDGLAAVDLSDNSVLDSFDIALDDAVVKLELDEINGVLYLSGGFTTVNGTPQNGFTAVNTIDGSLVGAFNPVINDHPFGMSLIFDMQLYQGNLYITGAFGGIDGDSDYHTLVALDPSDGSLIPTFQTNINMPDGGGGQTGGMILDIEIYNGVIYLAGMFTHIGDVDYGNFFDPLTFRKDLGAVQLSDGSIVQDFKIMANDPWMIEDGEFTSLAVADNVLYLGGIFNSLNVFGTATSTQNYIGSVDLTDYSLTSFDPIISGVAPDVGVTFLSVLNDVLYIGGGNFNDVGGTTRNNLAAINLEDDSLNEFNPDIIHTDLAGGAIRGILPTDNYLFLYGDFNTGDGYNRDYIAKFDNPNIQFTNISSNGNENVGGVSLELISSATSTLNTAVSYTVTGTATSTDHNLANGTATITAGNTTTTIDFTITDDAIDEGNETVIITLSDPVNASLGLNTVFTYTITDNDTVGITQSETTATVTEDGATDSYTLVLDSEPENNVVVTITPDAQTTVSSGTLTFTSANWNVAQTVTISAVDDDEDEDDSYLSTITHSVASSDSNYNGYSLSNITVTVTDNDTSGGGGLSPEAYKLPDEPWTVSINNGDKCTNSKNIKLKLTTGGRTKYFAISEDNNFTDESLILFPNENEVESPYILPEPLTISYDYNFSGDFGEKIVYVKYYTAYGKSSEVFSDSIIYTNNLEKCLSENQTIYTLFKYPNNPKVYLLEDGKKRWIKDEYTFNQLGYQWNQVETIDDSVIYPDGVDLFISQSELDYIFTRFLTIGSVGEEVKQLQTKLKILGYFTYPSITGYFGPITFQAVKDFQKDNGIIQVGYVGPQTRAVLNSL